MSKKPLKDTSKSRRKFTDQFKRDAVQMLLDGHTASSIVDRLGLTVQTCCTDGSESSCDKVAPSLRRWTPA